MHRLLEEAADGKFDNGSSPMKVRLRTARQS